MAIHVAFSIAMFDYRRDMYSSVIFLLKAP